MQCCLLVIVNKIPLKEARNGGNPTTLIQFVSQIDCRTKVNPNPRAENKKRVAGARRGSEAQEFDSQGWTVIVVFKMTK